VTQGRYQTGHGAWRSGGERARRWRSGGGRGGSGSGEWVTRFDQHVAREVLWFTGKGWSSWVREEIG
jgi:hypothetical protein